MLVYSDRYELLTQNIPQLFDPDYSPLNILYIGAHHKQLDMVSELREVDHKLTLLELHERFAQRYTLKEYEHDLFDNIVVGDVRNLDPGSLKVLRGRWPDPPVFNVTFWWHGPEHIREHEIVPTISGLERITKHLIVIACPWGKTKLSVKVDNGKIPGQVHLSDIYPDTFNAMGYKTQTIGEADGRATSPGRATHILAWKWMRRD